MEIPGFDTLYYALYEYRGEHIFQDILQPWLNNARQNMAMLKNYGFLESTRQHVRNNQEIEVDLWNWYALSRVSDYLLLAFQGQGGTCDVELLKGAARPFTRPKIQVAEYLQFFVALGMLPFEHKTFHPFFHEIVTVELADDPLEPLTLLEVYWPGCMFDMLLFARAGVKVRGGSSVINKEIAEKSKIHFTYIRRNRPALDLSHGWGHNSQWRTHFRRDYLDDFAYHFNVDGMYSLTQMDRVVTKSEQELTTYLTRDERIELLVNRCFIRTTKPDKDLWPFFDSYVEERPAVPVRALLR